MRGEYSGVRRRVEHATRRHVADGYDALKQPAPGSGTRRTDRFHSACGARMSDGDARLAAGDACIATPEQAGKMAATISVKTRVRFTKHRLSSSEHLRISSDFAFSSLALPPIKTPLVKSGVVFEMVEVRRLELLAFYMRSRRSTS